MTFSPRPLGENLLVRVHPNARRRAGAVSRLGSPAGSSRSAGGHESDALLPCILEITKRTLQGVPLPQEPPGIVTLAWVVADGRRGIDYYGHWEPLDHGVIAEMIYWEGPQGGRVFHGGCIATGWALSADEKLQALMRNVLHHFGVKAKNA